MTSRLFKYASQNKGEVVTRIEPDRVGNPPTWKGKLDYFENGSLEFAVEVKDVVGKKKDCKAELCLLALEKLRSRPSAKKDEKKRKPTRKKKSNSPAISTVYGMAETRFGTVPKIVVVRNDDDGYFHCIVEVESADGKRTFSSEGMYKMGDEMQTKRDAKLACCTKFVRDHAFDPQGGEVVERKIYAPCEGNDAQERTVKICLSARHLSEYLRTDAARATADRVDEMLNGLNGEKPEPNEEEETVFTREQSVHLENGDNASRDVRIE